jgi:predicted alpha/beta superfamily hydrolase
MNKLFVFIFLCGLLSLMACNPQESKLRANKTPSAQPNVTLYSELVDIPGLNRTRQLRIYLPPGYGSSDKHYPVLYMHDAQNLFDDATAHTGEWAVDELLNQLAASQQLELIVVGIDNHPQRRLNEMNPWDHPTFGKGEGREYMDFIARVVKPLMDERYRTRPEVEHTGIMGSSMGGYISHYAIVQYPDVFGRAGIFSPSYWISPEAVKMFTSTPVAKNARLYFYMGSGEGEDMVGDIETVFNSILAQGHSPDNAVLHIVPDAQHTELAWHNEFPHAVLWLFGEH